MGCHQNLIKKMFCLCMCLCVACAHVYACEKLGEGVGSPGAGVTRGYELPVLVVGTQVLYKSTKYSRPVRRLFRCHSCPSPSLFYFSSSFQPFSFSSLSSDMAVISPYLTLYFLSSGSFPVENRGLGTQDKKHRAGDPGSLGDLETGHRPLGQHCIRMTLSKASCITGMEDHQGSSESHTCYRCRARQGPVGSPVHPLGGLRTP